MPVSGKAPWLSCDRSWAGWVPNVSGHLSFSTLAAGRGRHTYNHVGADGRRSLMVRSRRSAQDFPLPGVLVGAVRRSVTLDYVLVARSTRATAARLEGDVVRERVEENGALSGIIAVLPAAGGRTGRSARADLLAELDALMRTGAASSASGLPDPTARDAADALVRGQAATGLNIVRFALFRSGEARVWLHDDEFLGRPAAAAVPTVPELIAMEGMPLQAYLFLKDVIHKHYHHQAHSDQLLVPERVDTAAPDARAEDANWRVATLRGLARVVTEYRQAKSATSNKQALGVLAYADAFQSLLARLVRPADLGRPVELLPDAVVYDFAHTRSSLETLDSIAEADRGLLFQLIGVLVGVFLSAAALWAGMVQIRPILCEPLAGTKRACPPIDTTTVDAVNLAVANPSPFITLLLVLGFTAFVGFFNGLSAIPWAKRFAAEIRRGAVALAADVARMRSDAFGWFAALLLLAGMVLAAAGLSWWLSPRKSVPPRGVPQSRPQPGRYASLDRLVGRPVALGGLLVDSAVAAELRSLLGSDYPKFVRLLGGQAALVRAGDVFWAAGSPSPRLGRDGAYLVIDRNDGRVEVGLLESETPVVYRSPGEALGKPVAVLTALGWSGADAGPMEPPTPFCRSAVGGSDGRVLQYTGNVAVERPCSYSLLLRAGQRLVLNPRAARSLAVRIAEPNGPPAPIAIQFRARVDGVHRVTVGWNPNGLGPRAASRPREFYLRVDVR